MGRREKSAFRGFGLGIMRRLRGSKADEGELVIRECKRLIGGGIFFDVGANVGEVSEAVAPLASRVVAMEADAGSYAQLVERLGDRAVCIHALIGPEGEQRTFLSHTTASKSSMSVRPGDEPPGYDFLKPSSMTAVSLDTVARLHGMPSLIKIDVEGFEMSILDSAKTVLALRPAVVMEFNALCLSNFGRVNPRDAIDRVLSMFPRVDIITPEGPAHLIDPYMFLSNNILRHGSVDNLICTWG